LPSNAGAAPRRSRPGGYASTAGRSWPGARVAGGEVDLVARRGHTLAFVEVKQRATAEAAAWSLDAYRLRRVAVAAEQIALRYARPGDTIRIDAIYLVPGRLPRHLPNVWTG
jgi:putative endonuclease